MNSGLFNERSMAMFTPMPSDVEFLGSDAGLRAVFPSGNGVGSALGIARLFAPFANGGSYNGVKLFSPETIAKACEQQWHHDDSMFGNEFRVALGLLLHCGFNDWGREGNDDDQFARAHDKSHRSCSDHYPETRESYQRNEGLDQQKLRLQCHRASFRVPRSLLSFLYIPGFSNHRSNIV